eukprot:25383_1
MFTCFTLILIHIAQISASFQSGTSSIQTEDELIKHLIMLNQELLPSNTSNIVQRNYALMERYEQINTFSNLNTVMDLMIVQNKKNPILDVNIWNKFFQFYFHSSHNITADNNCCYYLAMMEQTGIDANIDTFNIIMSGLNTNDQIIDDAYQLFKILHVKLMWEKNVSANMKSFENIMESLAKTPSPVIIPQMRLALNYSADDMFHQAYSQLNVSEKFIFDYLQILYNKHNLTWNELIDVLGDMYDT